MVTTAKRYLRQLAEFGYLEARGGNKNRKYECKLDFMVKPEDLTKHSITIKMKMSDGQEYTSEFNYDFATGWLDSD